MKSVIKTVEEGNFGDILISYKGKPSGDMINSVLHLVEGKLNKLESATRMRKKVFKIIVEVLQNFIHHNESLEEVVYPSFIFYLFKKEDRYTIISCNRQVEKNARQVVEKLDELMSLSASDLKNAYHEILGNGRFSKKGGAGLGLLEIIQKSGRDIEYEILPSDQDDHGLLFIKINVH